MECDLFLAVGTSLAVFPINETIKVAHQTGSKVIILNGEATVFDPIADVVLHAGISETLPRIVSRRSLRYGQLPGAPTAAKAEIDEVDIVGGAQLLDGATSCLMFGSLMSTTRVRSRIAPHPRGTPRP